MRRASSILLVLACLAAAGAARAEDPVQFFERLLGPPARTMQKALAPPAPAREAPAPEPGAAAEPAEEPAADLLSIPMPRLRPDDTGKAALGYAPASGLESAPLIPSTLTPPAAPEPEARPSLPLKVPPPAARSTCGAVIARLGVEATAEDSFNEGACGIRAPVSVAGLDGGAVAFTTDALLDCSLAEALATWMAETVQPIAARTLGARVTGLRIAASYACRNRDSLADAKLSEHARGNAIDISAFKLEGIGWIEVEGGWTGGGARAAFLRDVRQSACGPFTTVLGPGSDVYHSNHFHLDRAKRRTAGPSRGLYCH